MMRRRDFVSSALASAALRMAPAAAQSTGQYPDRPIRLIVPFAPGGGVDVLARVLAEKLKEQRDFTVVVENRAGANGSLGGAVVQHASPDGYTLLFSAATHVTARQVMRDAPYDPVTDFRPIARVGMAPMLLVMAPKLAPNTITELLVAARRHPEQWTFAAPSLGSPGHIAMIAFNQLAGTNLVIVPYRGTAPGLADVAAGHVQLMIDAVLVLLPIARSGQVKALAITTAKRSSLAPDIPTAAESGLPGLQFASWYGVWGPPDLPNGVVQFLNVAINEATRELEKSGRLAGLGVEAVAETPEQFARFIAAEVARNAELLRAANFQPL
jgi:tripartite-type tricarboxylate transporter receptor subunit TctC